MQIFSDKNRWVHVLSGIFLAIILVSGLCPGNVLAGAPDRPDPMDLQAFFDDTIQEQMEKEHIAGASVAVVQKDRVLFTQGYGYADMAAQLPVQPEQTLFFMGSAGKLLTWTAIMQLAGQGKLDLHADVNSYIDFEIPDTFPEPITLHHLMTHTAGFEEDFNSLLLDNPLKIVPLRDHLVRYMPVRVYPPGVISAYSNYGAALAGYIIERISGQSYETYLAEHLLKPLGMNSSFVGNVLPPSFASDLSKGYQYENGHYVPLDYEWTAAVPCAPIRTTITDFSLFAMAHLNGGCVNGNCILPAEVVRQMHSPQFTHHPQMRGMTYGLLDMEINGQRVLWHLGESARFHTLLALIPEQELGIIVSYNTHSADPRALLFRFMDTFFPLNRQPLEGLPLENGMTSAESFNGMYVPARSAHTTPQIFVRYIEAVPVTIQEGQVSFAGRDYVEMEPALFRQVDGDRVLTFKQDSDGKRWLFAGPLAYFQIPWYETPILMFPLLGVSLFVFLTAWIAALVITVRRKTRPGSEAAAWWLAAGLGLFDLSLFAWLVSVLLTLADRFAYDQNTVTIISILYWLAVPWTLAVLAFAAYAWLRRKWKLGHRIHYSFVALTAVAFVWLLWTLNLLGGRLT